MRPIKGVPVEMATYWMRHVGAMLLRNALMLEAEFGPQGLIPAEQQQDAERLMDACRDVLRAEVRWHGSPAAALLQGEGK